MAIYHFSAQIISRKTGRSSVAAAAYRSGEKMEDERTGLTYDYTKKNGIEYKEIIAPENSPQWVYDRYRLWNEVEKIEDTSTRRSTAQLSREINIALPRELTNEQQIELIRNFIKDNFADKGMCADLSIHLGHPHKYKEESEKNEKDAVNIYQDKDIEKSNPHAHIMLTTREVTLNGFGKKNRDWNSKELLEQWREKWAEYTNKALEKAGREERIDHRSLKEQGIDREAQIHVGTHANAIEKKKGIETDRGNINREIIETNKKLQQIKNEKIVLLNEYKILKSEQRQANYFFKKFNQKERDLILQAQKVLKRNASLDNIENGHRYLDKSISFWNGLDEKLSKKMKNLNEANYILQELKCGREKYKELPLFSDERRALKTRISELQDEFNKKIEFIEKYNKYGISSEKSFESKYSQLKNEESQKRQKYEQSRQVISNKKEILYNAEVAIKDAESRTFKKAYPEYMNVEGVEAASINRVNKMMGRNLSFEEINLLEERAAQLKHENERLSAAEKYIDEYEQLDELRDKFENGIGKVKRVFSERQGDEYKKLVQKMDDIKEKLSNNYFKINGKEDLYAQQARLKEDIGRISAGEIKDKESQFNYKEYGLYRYEVSFKEAKKIFEELQSYRQQLKDATISKTNTKAIENEIRFLQKKFADCKVGYESNFEKNYDAAIRDITLKRNNLESERRRLIENVNVDEICDQVINAKNSFIKINNQKAINEFYKNDINVKVVNDNEYRRTRDDEGSSRRDPEANGRPGRIFTGADRQTGSISYQSSGHAADLQGGSAEGQREDSRNIQQDSRGSKYTGKDNRGQVLETTTGGTKGSSGINKEQQSGDNIRVEKIDRKVSSKDRTSIFSKNSNSFFNSRFKSTMSNNIQNDTPLNEQLKEQIEENKPNNEKHKKGEREDLIKDNSYDLER